MKVLPVVRGTSGTTVRTDYKYNDNSFVTKIL